jgi:oxygen-independent coproporphyrinogen III oxidase
MTRETTPAPGLYIHIPFCKAKCGYCDFYSCTSTGLTEDFLHALLREMESCRDEFQIFDTVYLGGGTPSLLSPVQVGRILDGVRRNFRILPGSEITIEANPADWGPEDLLAVRRLGVSRINLGIQSFDDRELSFLGRRHNSSQAFAALDGARKAGFGSVGFDLMYGLPGQSFPAWETSLEKALQWGPDHLSCYELELKPDTPLGLRDQKGELEPRTEEGLREFFLRTSELAEGAGYIHYEVSNFAKSPGMASRHNGKYWDHTPYLGLGPSAHSFKGTRRWWNHDSLEDYLGSLKAGKRPVGDSEELDSAQLAFEALFLGLRMKKGIDLEAYARTYGIDLIHEKCPQLLAWQSAGLVEIEAGTLRPTREGMAVADALAVL